jgi:outer membrane protein OmpA-like peptidoglycan-associated protein
MRRIKIGFKIGWLSIFLLCFLLKNARVEAQIPIVENKIIITNEAKVNSKNLEYSPAFYKDGIVFISTSSKGIGFKIKDKNIGTNLMNIYQSKRDENGYLKEPEPFANELIAKVHDGPLTFDNTGSTMFFTRNEKKVVGENGRKKLQIFQAELIGEEWKNIRELAFNQDEHNFTHPTISADGNTLYFSSDIPGGEGGMDLYKSIKKGDEWGEPINLGQSINTAGNEIFPFIHADGTLYFASDDHSTMGGLDIFYIVPENDDYPNPINLGEPFNSKDDDFGFIVDADNKNGYYSSSRPRGSGGDDLYNFYLMGDMKDRFKKKKKKAPIALKDENGNPLDGAKISYAKMDDVTVSNGVNLSSSDNGDFLLRGNADALGSSVLTNENGETDIQVGDGNYIVTITKDGYAPEQFIVTPDTDLSELNVQMKKAANCVSFAGRIVFSTTNPVSGAKVYAVNNETGVKETAFSDGDGNAIFCLPCNNTYTVYATKNGMATTPEIISTKEISCDAQQQLRATLSLSGAGAPPVAGTVIALPNIYFNFDDASLRPDARLDLDMVVTMLLTYPDLKVELAAHTDARGSKNYNKNLSQRRAESVYYYLINKGISATQLTAKGYGEQEIRNRCIDFVKCSEGEHQANRRTELVVLGNGQNGLLSSQFNDEPDGLFFMEKSPVETDLKKINEPEVLIEKAPERVFLNQSPRIVEPAAGLKMNYAEKVETYEFMVIAGTFSEYENAQSRRFELINRGYPNARIVKASDSNLQSVIVTETNSEFDARALSQKLLRENGIDSYVKSISN